MKALLVDSDREALRFIKINLKILDPQIETELAFSRKTALEKLESNNYDCIVSEHMLPDTYGPNFCEEIKETCDTPFILYTSWRDEELAELAYKSGVDDIVRKEKGIDHFNILAKSIRDEVENHWQRKLYRDIVENSRDAILIIVDTTIEYVNDAAFNLFKINDRKEIIGVSAVDYLDPVERKIFKGIEARKEDAGQEPLIYDYLHSFGEMFEKRFEASISFITYHGQPAKLAFIRDITDRIEKEELLKALHNHAVLLNTAKDVEKIQEITLDIMEQVLGFSYASFQVVRGDALHPLGTRGAPLIPGSLPLDGKGITVRAAVTGKTQYVPDTREDPDFLRGSTDSLSELAVPVTVNGKTVAVLNIESLVADAFSVFDQQLLETLAMQVVTAIKEISHVNGDIETKISFMRDTLAQFTTLEDVAMYATTMLYSIIPTDKIALAVIEGNILTLVSAIGERVFTELSMDLPSINARAVKTRQTQFVNDTRLDPDYFPGDGHDAVTMLSELCVPMIHRGKVLGTINLECLQPGRFSEEDARVAEAFTREVADAVHFVRGDAPTGGLQTCYQVRNRSTMDNYHGILRAVYDDEKVLNRIVYRVALPWKRGKEMVNHLVIKGYLAKEQASAHRYVYTITDEGVKAMNTYEGIMQNLSA